MDMLEYGQVRILGTVGPHGRHVAQELIAVQ